MQDVATPAGPFAVVVRRGLAMQARDGTRLVMDLYLPAQNGEALTGPFPTLMERTPYNRGLARFVELGHRAAERGYAFVVQDVRGRFASGGRFHHMMNTPDEGQDGIDTVEWVRAQPWCDGRIGTVGGSFSAANQQAMALHRPAGLRAQILRDAGNNYYQRMFRHHGAFNLGVGLLWALDHGDKGHEAMADPSVAAALAEMSRDLAHWAQAPLRRGATPLARAGAYEDVFFRMRDTADDEAYWHNPTIRLEGRWDDYPTDVAILMISGWFAHHANANLEKLRELGRRSSRPVRLIMGPWIHSPEMIELTSAGCAEFGPEAASFGPISSLWLGWMDRFVRDGSAGEDAEPPVSYFVMGTGDGHRTAEGRLFHGGRWSRSEVWPPAHLKAVPWYLQADGGLSTEPAAPGPSSSTYVFDPADPCPGVGTTTQQSGMHPAFLAAGPQDQVCHPGLIACRGRSGPIADRPDVLVFESAPLDRPLEVVGSLALRLWVSSSAPDTDFTARLIDVYPSSAAWPAGFAMLLSEGILRMRYRNRQPRAELIEPGRIYEIEIELNPTANVFKAGHRIRLHVSSSSFPGFDVNPNTGEPLGYHTRTQPATQTIHHSRSHPSHIVLHQAVFATGTGEPPA